MKRLALLFAAGCTHTPDLHVTLAEPAGATFTTVKQLELTITRGDAVLGVRTSTHPSSGVSISDVTYGADTVLTMEGQDSAGGALARGATCATDFESKSGTVDMYFAPLRFFGETASAPSVERFAPAAAQLDDGTVLVVGGSDASVDGNALSSVDVFTPGATTFAVGPSLHEARAQAAGVLIPSVAFVVTDGVGAGGNVLASAEIYSEANKTWSEVTTNLDARVGHQAVTINGVAYLIGGRSSPTDKTTALATSLELFVSSDGTFTVTGGPTLAAARSGHAVALVGGRNLYAFGGYDSTGAVLSSIELVDATASTAFSSIAALTTPRAEATASVTSDDSIVIAGGKGAGGAVLDTLEVFNPFTQRSSPPVTMSTARYGHTATVLPNGTTVLIAGGYDANDQPLSTIELFDVTNGTFFAVSNELTTTRAGHVAVTNCDKSVLLTGGGSGAELYTPTAAQ